MQTALLDSYAILPLAASILIQGLTGFILLRVARKNPDSLPGPVFFRLSGVFVGLLGISSILAIIFPSLLVYSSGILLSSIILLLYNVLLGKARIPVQMEIPEDDITAPEAEEEQEDPLISIGQEFLVRINEAMTGEINIIRLLDFVNEALIEHTNANGGVVFLVDDFEDSIAAKSFAGSFPPPYELPAELPHKPVRVETNFRYVHFDLGETIFGEVAASGKSVIIQDGLSDERIFVNGPEEFLKPGSYMFLPLIVKGRVVGVAGVARLPNTTPFNEEDLRIGTFLADYAGSSINNIYSVQEILERADLEREASIAAKIQKTMQPKRLPDLPEVGFGSFFNPSKGVCGDYYDVILARRDRIVVTIADIAGKGIQSSMVMMMLRSVLHLVTNTTKDSGTILDWINKGITGKIDMDHYATLAYVSYSPETHEVNYSSAGHQPLLHWKAKENKIDIIRQNSDPIGVERSSEYKDIKLTVEKKDIIILFTDGLIESLNEEGHQYGIQTLTNVISENNAMSAKDIATEVKHNLQAFVGSASIHDDQSLVIMKIKA
ncbi:MAG TPA: SpoIIE family protein phosphatase [Treponema sp.]|nr:SpoIIE family protein phosphatase [Treponema sp.]